MISFSCFRAADMAGAVRELVNSEESRVIAGGTNLLDLMKENVERPRRLVDITRLPLAEIQPIAGGGLRLGALVTNTDVAGHARQAALTRSWILALTARTSTVDPRPTSASTVAPGRSTPCVSAPPPGTPRPPPRPSSRRSPR